MKRRDFIKTTGVVVAGAVAAPVTFFELNGTDPINDLVDAVRDVMESGPPPPEILMHPNTFEMSNIRAVSGGLYYSVLDEDGNRHRGFIPPEDEDG